MSKTRIPPIPSQMHLVWVGGKIPDKTLMIIGEVAACGKTIGSDEEGLEVNLWVDNVNKFKKAYEIFCLQEDFLEDIFYEESKKYSSEESVSAEERRKSFDERKAFLAKMKQDFLKESNGFPLESKLRIRCIDELGGALLPESLPEDRKTDEIIQDDSNKVGGFWSLATRMCSSDDSHINDSISKIDEMDYATHPHRRKISRDLLLKAKIFKGEGRNKAVAAADIIRALVLDQVGGVYCDIRLAEHFSENALRKFQSMPADIKHNFLIIPNYRSSNYAIARPETRETYSMIYRLYNKIALSHDIDSYTRVNQAANLKKELPLSILTEFGERSIPIERDQNLISFFPKSRKISDGLTLDDQSRYPHIMEKESKYRYFKPREGFRFNRKVELSDESIGVDHIFSTTGAVFDDVYRSYGKVKSMPQEEIGKEYQLVQREAKLVTEALFGKNIKRSHVGSWKSSAPSRKSEDDSGIDYSRKGYEGEFPAKKPVVEEFKSEAVKSTIKKTSYSQLMTKKTKEREEGI
jgi:hypothetical protein